MYGMKCRRFVRLKLQHSISVNTFWLLKNQYNFARQKGRIASFTKYPTLQILLSVKLYCPLQIFSASSCGGYLLYRYLKKFGRYFTARTAFGYQLNDLLFTLGKGRGFVFVHCYRYVTNFTTDKKESINLLKKATN